MSHRTAPHYGGLSSAAVGRGGQLSAASVAVAAAAPPCIFVALEQGRFDQVRRAVQSGGTPTLRRLGGADGRTTVVDYALELARLWDSLLAHCDRTGVVVSAPGHAGMRQRRLAMAAILEWLLTQPAAPSPSPGALHTAISCNYLGVAELLARRDPALATARDARGRTALHACMRLAARQTPADVLRHARLLRVAGARFDVRDADGRTPLHELAALAAARRAPGLTRTRGARASLRAARPVLEYALLDGAELFALDRHGLSPLHSAIYEGLDYHVLVRTAGSVYKRICSRRRRRATAGASMGLFTALPYDILLRILAQLTPRDAVNGVGMSCKTMNSLVTMECLWKHLSERGVMMRARASCRRENVLSVDV